MPRLIITFHGVRTEIEAPPESSIDELLLGAGFLIERQCAGRGTCGRCRIAVAGELGEVSKHEFKLLGKDAVSAGYRLACQATVCGEATVELSPDTVHSDKVFGTLPSPEDLPGRLGLALDLGTTTVGAFLVDMEDGRVMGGNAVLNRQSAFGADIISRLDKAADEPGKFSELGIGSLCEAVEGFSLDGKIVGRIEKAVVVGNTAMHHLLLGLSTDRLRVRPFEPSERGSKRSYGLFGGIKGPLKSVPVWIPPVIGGFVGSDTLACLSYFGFDRPDCVPSMAADLGTNGEVMVTDGKRILAASTAAGPAFEGVNISCGMRAAAGAITSAEWKGNGGDKFVLNTVGGKPPVGIAGSGLLSIVRLLLEQGIMQRSGRIVDPEADKAGIVKKGDDGKWIPLGGGLKVTQGDIRELQKAKGAIAACAEILIEELGMKPADLRKVFLTGSFGGRIDVRDVIELGVLPQVDPSRVLSFPNGAGLGAALFLNEEEFNRGESLAARVEHLALFDSPRFMDLYVDCMAFSRR